MPRRKDNAPQNHKVRGPYNLHIHINLLKRDIGQGELLRMSDNNLIYKLDSPDVLPFYKFEFFSDPIWIDWYGRTKKKFCLISIRRTNMATGEQVKIIHPVSEYILSRYSSREYNTMKKNVDNLIVFLNYLYNNNKKIGIALISELTLVHGRDFLNFIGLEKKLRKSTVQSYERTLTNFYVFLSDKGILETISKNEFQKVQGPWGKYYLSPFKGVRYPAASKKKIEHAFPLQYLPLLLEISIIVAPRITLGIYIQFMGGQRNGEVVNLKRTQAQRRVQNGDFIFKIENQKFRSDVKDHTSSEVKRPRTQEVFNIKDWLTTLFEDHITMYKTEDGSNALFVNARGKAMTAKSYSQYFNIVKKTFCSYLRVYGDEDDIVVADHLSTIDWSTHIGRGTFTNMIAERTDNLFLMAYKRGETNPESSMPYIVKTTKVRKKIEDSFKNLNNEYLPRLIDRRKELR
jgi:hypothetical protein